MGLYYLKLDVNPFLGFQEQCDVLFARDLSEKLCDDTRINILKFVGIIITQMLNGALKPLIDSHLVELRH